jgi:RNase H-like domain found in reverse transcriptase
VCAALPALRCPDWSKRFILETDALGYTLGAVISQEFDDGIYPIAFHSQSLLPAKKNYDTHDKELAAVLFRFKCGQPLFLGTAQPIEVRTDHKNLQYFHQLQKITGRQARWIEYLQDFDYKLTHVPGHTNTVADLLSRQKDLNKEVMLRFPGYVPVGLTTPDRRRHEARPVRPCDRNGMTRARSQPVWLRRYDDTEQWCARPALVHP